MAWGMTDQQGMWPGVGLGQAGLYMKVNPAGKCFTISMNQPAGLEGTVCPGTGKAPDVTTSENTENKKE